jgi:hypothetical protein
MKTKRSKNMKTQHNTTKKIYTQVQPSLKSLRVGYPLYASKLYEGSTILEYNRNEEVKYHDNCLMQNSSWFGDLNVAKSYKTQNTHIYKWKVNKITNLLNITSLNNSFINSIFTKTKIKLTPTINLTNTQFNKIEYIHPYLNMSPNEKALYEFKFCFGFITVEEQYQFMKFVKYLIENNFLEIKTRKGDSILKKIKIKIGYYKITSLLKKKDKLNRLSFYNFDKHAIMNLCKIVNNNKHNISGVYQKNDTSFWFPNLLVYKMNIQEYILFNPHHNLVYDKLIE